MDPDNASPEVLADTQFDYPGQPNGWRYYALNAANQFAELAAPAQAANSATPLASLGCEDPNARIGRDALHVGYERRPCLQWHPRQAGSYRVTGEMGLMNSRAASAVQVRVIVDDVEVLRHELVYPQVLDFELEAAVGAGGFVRLLFAASGCIDFTETLFYLRAFKASTELAEGTHRISYSANIPSSWQRLGAQMGQVLPGSPQELAQLAKELFHPRAQADPAWVQALQGAAMQPMLPKLAGYRKPRFFSIHPLASMDSR